MIAIPDITEEQFAAMPAKMQTTVKKLLMKVIEGQKRKKMYAMYPETDTEYLGTMYHSRHKYKKHMEFFEAGATRQGSERCAMCANRIGKTFGMGAYEVALHVTGEYPHWWVGKRFVKAPKVWVAGKTTKTTRDIIQSTLFGPVLGSGVRKRLSGHGMVLGDRLRKPSWANGLSNFVDTVPVMHSSGEVATIGLKSYEQGRGAFEGDAIDIIWLDEEAPLEVYEECLVRLMTTGGILILTYTPLEGLSQMVLQFLPDMNPESE